MKKYVNIAVILSVLMFFGTSFQSDMTGSANHSIKLQFITYNGFGNNLYIDNILIGKRPEKDVAVTSVNNLPKDTFYLPGTQSITLRPQVTVTNVGLTGIADSTRPVYVYLNITPGNYSGIDSIPVIASGTTQTAEMDSVTLDAGSLYSITAYLKYYDDSLNYNDTLKQTIYCLSGFRRHILAEEFTSYTSPSCGSQNPFLDSFITANSDTVCAVKYHVGFPSLGIDSFYFSDSLSVNARRNYYFNQSVPQAIFDGVHRIGLPFAVDTNLTIPYLSRLSSGSPLQITVKDSTVNADSVVSAVSVVVLHPLTQGNYKLRIAVVEKYIIYSLPPGASGETEFYDVFRKMLPDSNGISVSSVPGSYQFKFGFRKNDEWTDSLIYTVAFVQNDVTREVMNCGKSSLPSQLFEKRLKMENQKRALIRTAGSFALRPDTDAGFPFNHLRDSRFRQTIEGDTASVFSFENFEGSFPPSGWTLYNTDGWITFERAQGVNGVSLGGQNSVRMRFYEYTNIGQKDTLESAVFDSVKSTDTLYFDYSYAQYLSGYVDSLYVNISTDGGLTYSGIFSKGGQELATALSTTLPYSPVSATQWETVVYPMSQILPPENPQTALPNEYELLQNYPNPFNPVTTITLKLPYSADVQLVVYDVTGREIVKLLNGKLNAGITNVKFDASGLSSGVYFYRMTAGGFRDVKKMVFIR